MSQGTVTTVKDLVIKVEFASDLPEIGEVVIVQNQEKSPLMVEHLLNDTTAICINLRSSKHIQKAMSVERTGKGVEIPVGQATIGRIFDALGEPLDGKAPLPADHPRKNILKVTGQKQRFYSQQTRNFRNRH